MTDPEGRPTAEPAASDGAGGGAAEPEDVGASDVVVEWTERVRTTARAVVRETITESAVARAVRLAFLRANTLALRGYFRLVPGEQHRILLLTVAIGVVCGFAAVAFHVAIQRSERGLIDRALNAPGWWFVPATIALSTLGSLAVGVFLERVMPEARGSGIPQVKIAYAMKSGQIRLRHALGKAVACVVQIGTGASLGREGPTVYICAGIASTLGRWFAISPENQRRLLPVGTAAGIAAAFNTPIAAVTFTIEELVGDLDQTVLSGVVVAAAVAAIIERTVLGAHPIFSLQHPYELQHTSSLLVFALIGCAAAVVGHLFVRSLLTLRLRFRQSKQVPGWARPAVGGFVTGVLAAGFFAVFHARGVSGGGYSALAQALGGELPLDLLVAFCLVKVVATVFSYASGGAGGIFAPTLFIGGMLGGAFGGLDRWLLGHADVELGAFALVGMGALFASVIRAPITSLLIIFEMTNGYGLILPLMIANSIAYLLSRSWQHDSIYEALLEQDGVRLPPPGGAGAALSALTVRDAMTTINIVTLSSAATVRAACEGLRSGHSMLPVLSPDGRFVGLVSEAHLRRRLAEGAGDAVVNDEVIIQESLRPGQLMLEAVVRMNTTGLRQMAVVEEADDGVLVGIFAMSDVIRAHAGAAGQHRESHAAG